MWVAMNWWRVICITPETYPIGHLWCETSDLEEARQAVHTCPGGGQLQRLYARKSSEWRDEP